MTICTKCKLDLADDEFDPNPKKLNGLDSWCRECRNEYQRLKHRAVRAKSARGEYTGTTNYGQPVTGVYKPMGIVKKEVIRQQQIVKYGIAVVEALEGEE